MMRERVQGLASGCIWVGLRLSSCARLVARIGLVHLLCVSGFRSLKA